MLYGHGYLFRWISVKSVECACCTPDLFSVTPFVSVGSFWPPWSFYSGPIEKSSPQKARGRDQTIFTNGKRRWVTHRLHVVYLTSWHIQTPSSWHLHQLAEYWHHPDAVINSFSCKQASYYSLNVLIWSISYFRALRSYFQQRKGLSQLL